MRSSENDKPEKSSNYHRNKFISLKICKSFRCDLLRTKTGIMRKLGKKNFFFKKICKSFRY